MDLCCLSYWHPLLVAAGIPTPRTVIVLATEDLLPLMDGKEPKGWEDFLDRLKEACDKVGYPAFLRTGQTSGKHQWSRTAFLENFEDLPSHVHDLVEFSEMADFMGLPHNVWAVREFLKLDIAFTLPGYCGMPVAREFRCFVEGGAVRCIHSYWPADAVEEGRPEDPQWREKLADISRLNGWDEVNVYGLAERVSAAIPGAWSVDICRTADGRWLVTDMAEAKRSFHWPECLLRGAT